MQRLQWSLALTATVGYGVLFYTFSVALSWMIADLGWSNAMLSAGVSVGLVTAGLVAPFVGRVIDQHGARKTMTAGVFVGGAGMLLWASSTTVVAYLSGWLIIGAGMGTTLYEPAFAAITRHAPDHRRRAIMAVALAGGLASTIFIPVTEVLVNWLGWRLSLVVLGSVYVGVAAPLHWLSLPSGGRQLGVGTEGSEPAPHRVVTTAGVPNREEGHGEVHSPTLADSPIMRRLVVGLALGRSSGMAVGAHLVAFLVVTGRSATAAAALAAGLGVAKFAGRLAAGMAARGFSGWWLLVCSFGVQALGLVLPLVAPSGPADAVMIALYGAGNGAVTVVTPLYIAELFGTRGFGLTSGRAHRVTAVSSAVAPAIVGAVVTLTASYSFAWLLLATSCVAAMVVLPRAQRRRRSSAHEPS